MSTEGVFKKKVKERLKRDFPGCVILQNDPTYYQGISDILVLYNDRWAALEFKRSKCAPHRPNQDYYVNKLNEMSYASFIYPENEEEVFNELERALEPSR